MKKVRISIYPNAAGKITVILDDVKNGKFSDATGFRGYGIKLLGEEPLYKNIVIEIPDDNILE